MNKCDQPTFIGRMMPARERLLRGYSVSTADMQRIQRKHLNPALKNCSKAVELEQCLESHRFDLEELVARVSTKLE